MPEGRFLSKSIASSEQLTRVSLAAEVVFYRLIPHADIEGRLQGDPFKLKSIVAPMRGKLPVGAIHKALVELEREGLVVRYHVGGAAYLRLPGFSRHQKLRRDREAASKIPPDPSEGVDTPDQLRSTPDLPGGAPPEVEDEVEVEVQVQGQVTNSIASARAKPDVEIAVDSPPPDPSPRAALARFLAAAPESSRQPLRRSVEMWRSGHQCPPGPKPSQEAIAAALDEYAIEHTKAVGKGNAPFPFTTVHVWSFVAKVQRRFAAGATGPPGTGRRRSNTAVDRTVENSRKLFETVPNPR